MSKNNQKLEREALIFNKQKYNMYDGPGVRTLVFFKGCPLRCKWCSNPESIEPGYSVMFKEDLCKNCGKCAEVCPVGIHKMVDGKHIIDRKIACTGCKKCEEVCPHRAISIIGYKEKISDIADFVEEDRAFYDTSGGGVTLSGGEVTAQVEAAENLLMTCKRRGINTAIETCGYAKKENILRIAEFTDLFLFDLKQINPEKHSKWTGVRNERIIENLKELFEKRFNVRIRMPLLKGINDSKEDIEGIIQLLLPYKEYKNFKGIDLLPYHKLGVNKYKQLGKKYEIEDEVALEDEELEIIAGYFREYDFDVNILKH